MMKMVNEWNGKVMGTVNGLTITLNNGATYKAIDKITLNGYAKKFGCVIK